MNILNIKSINALQFDLFVRMILLFCLINRKMGIILIKTTEINK